MSLLRKDGDKGDARAGAAEAALSIIAAGMRIIGKNLEQALTNF